MLTQYKSRMQVFNILFIIAYYSYRRSPRIPIKSEISSENPLFPLSRNYDRMAAKKRQPGEGKKWLKKFHKAGVQLLKT